MPIFWRVLCTIVRMVGTTALLWVGIPDLVVSIVLGYYKSDAGMINKSSSN